MDKLEAVRLAEFLMMLGGVWWVFGFPGVMIALGGILYAPYWWFSGNK